MAAGARTVRCTDRPRSPAVALGDVDDLAGLVARIADATLRRAGAAGSLTREERQDLTGYLTLAALELHARYLPGVGTFSGHLSTLLPLRVWSWYTRSRPAVRVGRSVDAAVTQTPLLESDLPFLLDDVAVEADGGDWQERVEEQQTARAVLAELSPESKQTLSLIVAPLASGATLQSLASGLGEAEATLRRRVRAVRADVLANYRARAHGIDDAC